MDYFILAFRKYLVQFLSNFIPSRKLARKFRQKFLRTEYHIFLDQVDSFIPKAVLENMNKYDNKYFYNENLAHGGGGIALIRDILILMRVPKKLTPLVILGLL
ncbi:hypothetical protein DMB92_01235 [Campylobacter sp. MIT 99-7217]|uniref:hypothetical protein n=1 Tax=Campylobacter sp. MIT 99-7217 TaxID=535091 RepID=UPI00115B1787|nr:hypothetical protein [Campylobacter sp. MIT 99-7217]TQR34616.1 hypothetical protein DMB92_01235 [Campylobacter sp. MIT 99-7217]